MELYQEVVSCTVCGARITLAGLREAGEDRVTSHAVDCPICRSRVPFAIQGGRKPGEARLICYERPVRTSPGWDALTRGAPPRRRR